MKMEGERKKERNGQMIIFFSLFEKIVEYIDG